MTTIVANNSTSDSDLWIIKIDSSGLEEWNFTYGGQYWDEGYDIIENSAGGYTITGRYSYSSFCDLWILKIDTNGSVIWSEKFGGQNSDYGHSIVESHDGGYVAVGHGYGLGNGNAELIAVKVDSNGTEVWTETFGGSNADYGWEISLTSSNGFIIGGYSYSFSTSSSNGDGWLIHLDSNGSELWSDTYGSINGYEDIYSVDQTTDGGFVAVGSKPIVSTGTRGLWMFKTDINGSILWDYSYATNSGGVFQDLMISSNGDLFALGYSSVNANDLWVIKTNESGIEEFNLSEGGSGVDYGVKIIDINSTIISLIGATSSFGNGSNNPWLLRINYSSSSTFIDSDGDGVEDSLDAFPNDVNETADSDNDGVGDNADAFPNDVNETADSDNDGLGDNEDEYPLINNFIDSDGDEVPDLFDDFINDPTQWNDYDGDGYGDYSEGNNSDAFINNESQWSDTDGDGYGDNWGNSTWNQTRLFIWPGQFVENAVLADHCPTEYGNSTANGYFGCPDVDGDGIADIYDDLIPNESENENQSNETETVDSDGDGVEDLFDFCPNTVLDGYVDIDGCLFDSDGDGVDDLKDTCPDTKLNVSVNVNGCEVNDDEGQSFIDSLSSGDQTAVLQTVGAGAVLIALFGFLQTNMIAALLPDSVRWLRVLKGNSKLNKEETRELEYLKSLVQTYYQDPEMLQSELSQLKSELTARYTNSEISKITREKLNTLISDLLAMNAGDLSHIANNDTFFGLGGALSTKERVEYLEQDALMRFDDNAIEFEQELESAQTISSVPLKEMKGQINETDGHEYLEHPTGSDSWYYRNHSTGEWVKWDN